MAFSIWNSLQRAISLYLVGQKFIGLVACPLALDMLSCPHEGLLLHCAGTAVAVSRQGMWTRGQGLLVRQWAEGEESQEWSPCRLWSKHASLCPQPKPVEVQVITHHMQRYAVWFGGSMLASTVSPSHAGLLALPSSL